MAAGPILLTGSSGFVARHLIPRIERAFPGQPVVRVAYNSPPPAGGFSLDLADAGATDAMIREVVPGVVIHLAALAWPTRAREVPSLAWRANRDTSFRLARAVARLAPAATVLLTSSAEVYGHSLAMGPADEGTPARPFGPYAVSKLAAEAIFREVLPQTSRLVIARPFNHSGPGQDERFVIPALAAQVARIEAGLAPPVIRVGNLAPERDILDVRDVADAYVALLANAERLPRHAVVNVTRGRAVSIRHLLETLVSLAGIEVAIEVDPARYRPADIAVATATSKILSGIMPWPPARPLEETLKAVLDEQRTTIAASKADGGGKRAPVAQD